MFPTFNFFMLKDNYSYGISICILFEKFYVFY